MSLSQTQNAVIPQVVPSRTIAPGYVLLLLLLLTDVVNRSSCPAGRSTSEPCRSEIVAHFVDTTKTAQSIAECRHDISCTTTETNIWLYSELCKIEIYKYSSEGQRRVS